MEHIWQQYQADFNAMTDEEIDRETERAESEVEEQQSWIEAVALWRAAGKPRKKETPGQ